MAGIGWRLERLIDRDSLGGTTAAYATGAAVMTMPWVLTTAALVSLPAILGRDAADFDSAERVVEVAYAVALLVDGPLQIVVSRHTADRLYEGRLEAIAAPLRRGLGAALLVCAAASAFALVVLGMPLYAVLWGAALSAGAGAQWTAISVGNGLCSPSLVIGAVAAGAFSSVLLAPALVLALGLGVPGYLLALAAGPCLTLAVLLAGSLRALPEETDESARLLPAFREYAALAGAGLAFNASLWADKTVVWWVAGPAQGKLQAAASTVAWVSTIPCLAWIFVEVETAFQRRFRAFYSALEGGASLAELRGGVRSLEAEAARLLRGAAGVQAGVIVCLEIAATVWIRWFRLPATAAVPFRLLLIGAGMQALALLGLVLLYYFDLRREACRSAMELLAAITVLTAVSSGIGWPPSLGTATGCTIGAALVWRRVRRGVRDVLRDVLLGQPFGSEEMSASPEPSRSPR